MKRHVFLAAAMAAAAHGIADAQPDPHAHTTRAAAPAVPATAVLRDAEGRIAGQATFTATADGVKVSLSAEGLAPGAHGFHVHDKGDCAPGPDPTGETIPFGAAGGHFDPLDTGKHAGPEQASDHGHAGDLPNLTTGADGKAEVSFSSAKMALSPGPLSVVGRSLVVHEKVDDYQTDPAGNSGARLLCGVIEAGKP